MSSYKLFTYGTLRRGFGNHFFLEHVPCLGKAKTEQPFVLATMGLGYGLPIVYSDPNGGHVVGEVYEVPKFLIDQITRMEIGAGYVLEWHPVTLESGEKLKAIIYTYDPKKAYDVQVVPSGDYADQPPRHYSHVDADPDE